MPELTVEEYIGARRELLEAALRQALRPAYPGAERLFAAMEYSLLAGGKRLRPLLFLAAAEGFARPEEQKLAAYLPFAAGIEMLHTYSLIHDDLPAMDDDDLRRGRPSCHKQFDEATAILAGDGLLTHCFAQMLAAPLEPARLVQAVKYLAENAGVHGMVAGQTLDILAEGKPVTLAGLQEIHRAKTGALLAAAVVCGGILGGADLAEQRALAEFGFGFGLAFQIMDDILDVTGDEKLLGKPVGSDAANGKTTYVSLLGLAGAQLAAQETAASALAVLEPLGDKARLLRELAGYYLQRDF